MQLGAERMKPELERGHDPEVPAGTAHAPEQLRLLRVAGTDEPPFGRHELHGTNVVDGQPEPPLQPADAAAQRETGDAGVPHDADRADEAVRLRRDVELAEQRAAVHPCRASHRIDGHPAHPREVDDQSPVRPRVA
jgi:hypothetical protein